MRLLAKQICGGETVMEFTLKYKYENMTLIELSELLKEFEDKLKANTSYLECVELNITHAIEADP